ncbi:MAG: response regulator transcription factor [Bacteroidales bacterium]|nr:response regulator transcription factor [Bacteroidales bacterium]
MRIMIVDDNKAFREATKHFLSRNTEYQVVAEAENGNQAIELFYMKKPDLILMDLEMPGLNGMETTKLLLKKDQSVKIIAVSNYQEPQYINDVIEAGFLSFVNKNNITDHLEDAIANVLNGKFYLPKE